MDAESGPAGQLTDDGMSSVHADEVLQRQVDLDLASAEFLAAFAVGVQADDHTELYSDGTYRPMGMGSRPLGPVVGNGAAPYEEHYIGSRTGSRSPRRVRDEEEVDTPRASPARCRNDR